MIDDNNTTLNQTLPTTPPPPTPPPPMPTTDPAAMFENITLESSADYAIFYAENSAPVPLTNPVGTLVEDDDDTVLQRLEVVLTGVRDQGRETVFFDSDSLSRSLIGRLFLAAESMAGYLGDSTTCTDSSGSGITFEEIDLRVDLTLLEWGQVLRSLRYCSSDHDPVPGTRTVTFRIQDPSGAWSEERNTSVEVFAINDAPTCLTRQNTFTIDEDSTLTVPVLGNCFDHEDTLTGTSIIVSSQPQVGVALVDADSGDIVFQPAQDDYGVRRLVYQACDSEGLCSLPQTLTVIINPINDPPYPTDDLEVSVDEDTPTSIPLTLYFGDVEDDLIPGNPYPRVNTIRGNTGGGFSLEDDLNSTVMYTPFDDFIGRDLLILEVCDSVGACVDITLVVLVMSVNDPPDFVIPYPPPSRSEFVTVEDTPLTFPLQVRDIEDNSLIAVTVVAVGNGIAQPNLEGVTTGRGTLRDRFIQNMAIDYFPDLNFFGEDFVIVEATDSDGNSTRATIRVRVSYVNDPPVFSVTDVTILEDEVTVWTLPFDLGISDPEDVLHAGSFRIVGQPLLGNLTYEFDEDKEGGVFPETGVLTYVPPAHFFTKPGVEFVTFELEACDNDTVTTPLCANHTFRLTILSDNDAPHLPRVRLDLYEDNPLRVNLWEYTSDVEDGRPPMENVTLIDPAPSRGVASYNPETGYLMYVPRLNEYGTDFVYYNACDSENHCAAVVGVVEISVLEVNDPPTAADFTHIAREDDFDLIGFFQNITDNETTNLRIEIVEEGGAYTDVWTTPIGGRLRVYHAHQIITYLPPPEYVGPDSFRYSVCDTCDPRRDRELGRVEAEPRCLRQLEENGGNLTRLDGVYITCAEAEVELIVANIDDVPFVGDIAGVTIPGVPLIFTPLEDAFVQSDSQLSELVDKFLFRNSSSPVFEYDDEQAYLAAENSLNLTLYDLSPNTDINGTSLRVLDPPSSGDVLTSTLDGLNRFTYFPRDGFAGYDSFRFEVCDKGRQGRAGNIMPRCADGTASVWVTIPGPSFASLTAMGAMEGGRYTDSKVGTGDIYELVFEEDTNRPPYGSSAVLTTEEVNQIFTFDPPFFLDGITSIPYTGQWVSPTRFQIKIVDEGYPVPFQTRTGIGEDGFRVTRLTGVKVGEWRVSVHGARGPCGGFDENGRRLLTPDPFCLLNAQGTSLQSTSVSPELGGDYGLRLPNISNVVIRNVAVDDDILVESLDSNLFYEKSQVSLLLQPPLSYEQLAVYCEKDGDEILRTSGLADAAEVIVVGCANLLSNGSNADEIYSQNIETMRQAFFLDETGARRRREADHEDDDGHLRMRRQTVGINNNAPYPLPVASEVVLQVNSISNPKADPASDPAGFVRLIQEGFNFETLAEVVFETLGVRIDDLTRYSQSFPLAQNTSFYYEFDDDLTPQIMRVEAADPDNADIGFGDGDTVTIFFDRSTDQPSVGTKQDLDRIFQFEPGLGLDYAGVWISPSVLEITVLDAGPDTLPKPTTNPVLFNLTFTPNHFHTGDVVTSNNTILPTETPWCIGLSVCGTRTLLGGAARTVGVCSANGLSCRAHQGWTDLSGNFGTGEPIPREVFPWWWILIAIVVVLLIAFLIVVAYLVYRHYTHKAVRKEALRVIRRWKKDQFAPGKEAEKKEEPKPWVKPPDVSTMRDNPDPFDGSLKKLPEMVQRPPTALIETERLPPVPQFPIRGPPRGFPQIRPPVTFLPPIAAGTPSRRSLSTGTLPPGLVS